MGIPLQDIEGKTTQQLKNMIASYLDTTQLCDKDNKEIQDYDKKINKYSDEITRLQQSEPHNKKHRQFLEAKIREYGHHKSKVQFMRFLSEKLPLKVIADKRADILEMDILLKAFGL